MREPAPAPLHHHRAPAHRAQKGTRMLEKFHYRTSGGEEIVLPKYKHLKAGLVRRIRKLSPTDQIFTALEEVATPEQIAVVDELTQDEMNELVTAWQKDSQVTAGESPASSGS